MVGAFYEISSGIVDFFELELSESPPEGETCQVCP